MKKLLAQKKKTFQKFWPFELSYKKKIDKPGQMIWLLLYIKYLEHILLIPSLITTTGT